MNTFNKSIFAKRLHYYMGQKGVDRRQLCDDLNLKYSTVSEWLTANKYPRIDKIELLANYFGITKSNLIEDDKPADTLTVLPQNKIHMIPVFGSVAAGFGAYASHYDNKRCTNFQVEFVQTYKSIIYAIICIIFS